MIEVDWRVAFIDYIQKHKLPPSVDKKALNLLASYGAAKGMFYSGATCTSMNQHQAYS
jgi:hypothetical protein